MDIQTLASALSITKELNSFWKNLGGSEQDKLDALARKAAHQFLPEGDENIAPVREFLVNGKDNLAARITGAVMHPGTKLYFGSKFKSADGETLAENASRMLPPDILVMCKNCNHPNHVELYNGKDEEK